MYCGVWSVSLVLSARGGARVRRVRRDDRVFDRIGGSCGHSATGRATRVARSLAAHRRRLRLRRTHEALRRRVLPLVVAAFIGVPAAVLALGGGVL